MRSKNTLFPTSLLLRVHSIPHLFDLLVLVCVCVRVVCYCMPPLKWTKLQIQERTTREIRERTAAKLAQLCPKRKDKATQTEQESDEEDSEDGCDDRTVDSYTVLLWLCCFLLFLCLAYCVNHLYHAKNQSKHTF